MRLLYRICKKNVFFHDVAHMRVEVPTPNFCSLKGHVCCLGILGTVILNNTLMVLILIVLRDQVQGGKLNC